MSLAALTRGRGWNSELTGFLLAYARRDFLFKEYDFLETAITDDPNADWTLDNGGGTGAADFAKTAHSEDGRITGDTGTDADKGVAMVYDSIMFDAAFNPGMQVIMQVDDISEFGLEIGFSDALTDESLMAFTDLDTATLGNGGTDAVMIACDTDSATNDCLVLATGGTTDGDALALLGTAGTDGSPLTAATDFVAVVQAYANAGYAIVDDNLSLAKGLATGPDTAKLMRPRIMCITRDTTAKFPQVDLIQLWANRRGA